MQKEKYALLKCIEFRRGWEIILSLEEVACLFFKQGFFTVLEKIHLEHNKLLI